MNLEQPIAVLSGARTPMAKAFTELSTISAVDLGVHAVKAALQSATDLDDSITAGAVDQVVMGNVAGPPDAANIGRVIALRAGIPVDRIAHTVNRNCASGMESILAGMDIIHSGRGSVVVSGGTESMSQIPMLYHRDAASIWMQLARAKTTLSKLKTLARFRLHHFQPVVGIELGLTDPVSGLNMGQTAEVLAREFSISRDDQDGFALESHRRAAAARERCFLSGEIEPYALTDGRTFEKDNGPRQNQSLEQLAKLRPIFEKPGTVTPGNSCPLTDGAAAVVLSSVSRAAQMERPLGYITHVSIAGCDPHRMGLGPVYAIAELQRKTGLRLRDFDLIELNEAFAAQVIACQRAAASKSFAEKELGLSDALGELSPDRLNIHGGAIALGHPVGMTGTRLVVTLLRALRESGLRRGLATLCVGVAKEWRWSLKPNWRTNS